MALRQSLRLISAALVRRCPQRLLLREDLFLLYGSVFFGFKQEKSYLCSPRKKNINCFFTHKK
jgi:hypothetical protein